MSSSARILGLAGPHRGAIDVNLAQEIASRLDQAGWDDPSVPGDVYEKRLTSDKQARRSAGAYYTPGYMVDVVLDRVLGDDSNASIIDPACGGGAFLIAAYNRGFRNLTGVDIDPCAAAICYVALRLAGAEDPDVRVCDSLLDVVETPGNAGFDAVVGNPPWGQKGLRFATPVARRLRGRYRTARGVLDPFKLFIERGLELLAPGGRMGWVLPDIILLKDQQPVRDLVLEQTSIEWLIHAGRAFADVSLDAAVMVARKAPAPASHQVSIWRELPADWRSAPPTRHRLPQTVFGELPGHRFNLYLDPPTLALLRRVARLPRFGDYFEVHEGVHTGNSRRKLFCDDPRGSACARLIVGRDELSPFRLRWAGQWLDRDPGALDRAAGDYANLGKPAWHRAGKLVVRRTGDRVIAALDRDGFHVTNNAFVALPRAGMTDDELLGFLGLLNSRFMTWYFRAVQPRVGRLFAELKINHLSDFPVPPVGVAGLAQAARALERDPECGRGRDALDAAVARAFELTAADLEMVMS